MPLSAAQKQKNLASFLHFVLFALATLPCTAAHKHGHRCIHDTVVLREPLISAQQYEGDRRLQSWESIRITFDVNGIDSSLTAAQKTYITKLITDAGDWLRASLMVKRVSGNLKFDDFGGTRKRCGEVNLTASEYTKYISPGVAADLVIFVLAQGSVTQCKSGDVLAYASHCRQDQDNRPTFGYIQMCPQHFAVTNIQAERDQDFHTAVHEITHILGFSSALFPFFRDINGVPYTARCGNPSTNPTSWLPPGVLAYTGEGPQGNGNPANTQYANAWCCDGGSIGLPPWNCQYEYYKFQVAETVLKVQTVGGDLDRVGNTSRMLVTPNVVSVARQHFGCPTLAGVELEDDGGAGSAGSHWEERQMMSEYMVAASNPWAIRIVKSSLTLALLQDSGWYKVDYAAADILRWGYRQGCQFLNSCGSQSSIGWCPIQPNHQCSFDRSGMGTCSKSDRYMDGCPVTRNYEGTCNWGWLEPEFFYGGSCGGKDCTGGTFSSASACFESSLFSSEYVLPSEFRKPVSCYDYACIPTNTFTSGIILARSSKNMYSKKNMQTHKDTHDTSIALI
jgi:hypothetical protein